MHLPDAYITEMKTLLGSEYPDYLEALGSGRSYGLRINTGKTAPSAWMKRRGLEPDPVPWTENGFYYEEDLKPTKHPDYYAGLYYVQEPSAMAPAAALPVEPGDMVLDLCAAPGGKSTELLSKLGGSGFLLANDISASRCKALLKNLELWGYGNYCISCENSFELAKAFPEFFDRILLDAPCSGEGMFRKDGKMTAAWENAGPSHYHPIQVRLILDAWKMLKPGGLLLYSTCTYSPLEDEGSVLEAMSELPDMRAVPMKEIPGGAPGINGLECARRMYPHRVRGEGHFLILLEKADADDHVPGKRKKEYRDSSRGGRKNRRTAEFEQFSEMLAEPVPPQEICENNGKLYRRPPLQQSLPFLRIIRNGMYLGEEKQGRFIPGQALAMSLSPEKWRNSLDLKDGDDRILRYLKGETIETDGEGVNDGWVLICFDGFPLGWGKKKGTTIKNKYLPGWRYLS